MLTQKKHGLLAIWIKFEAKEWASCKLCYQNRALEDSLLLDYWKAASVFPEADKNVTKDMFSLNYL